MSPNLTFEERLDRLAQKLTLAPAVTGDLVSEITTQLCTRLPNVNLNSPATIQIERLIWASAWTDAALMLIQLEAPNWKLRRLVCDEGDWLCSLSAQPNLPVALDETADARHEDLVLAILGAFVEALRINKRAAGDSRPATVPQIRWLPASAVCCDNFA